MGLVFGGFVLFAVIWALALLTNFTALQRILEVWRQAPAEHPAAIDPGAVAAVSAATPAEPESPDRRRSAKQKLARQPEL